MNARRVNGLFSHKIFGLICGCLALSSCGFEVVSTGHRGVRTHFGEIQGEPLQEGFYTHNPFTEDIISIDVREQKLEQEMSCFTKDTQHVKIKFVITYYPNPTEIHHLYKQFGKTWDETIIVPASLGGVRDVIGRYVADDLVSKLEDAKKDAETELKSSLAGRSIFLTRLDFTEVDFDEAYKKAIVAKVVAVQRAAEAKNKTQEIEEQAKQSVISAEAEAKSMMIRSQALSQNKGLVEYELAQKWDGVLPNVLTIGPNAGSMLNIPAAVVTKKQ